MCYLTTYTATWIILIAGCIFACFFLGFIEAFAHFHIGNKGIKSLMKMATIFSIWIVATALLAAMVVFHIGPVCLIP